MGLSDDNTEENADQRYEDLCLDLNLDRNAKDEAWESFQRISLNYTLEGDSNHWLACALYVACRKRVPTVAGQGEVEGNCVSLTRLLRSTKLRLITFFNKMKKWTDMANSPQDFREKVDRLERNFAVSTVIFKKFQPIFINIFRNPVDDPPRPPRSRKQRRLPCTVSEVFNFCWTMFVQVKGNFPAISDDLVNSYHLLLCCIDWFYANAIMSNRRDLLNPRFSGLPENFTAKDFKPPSKVPCIIELLCDRHEGLIIEAKVIKQHWWNPYIKKLFDRKTLKGKVENLTGMLEISTFEPNMKEINRSYESYVLSVGDFDERIFLGEDASEEIGTPAQLASTATGELAERIQTRSLAPSTPLTGRRYLKEKEPPVTPVSTATQSVSRLQTLLSGRKCGPSDALMEIFSHCSRDPKDDILARVKQMGENFCTQYDQPSDDQPGSSQSEFAKKRLQLGESLYYKTLDTIMLTERRRLQSKEKTPDLSNLLEQDIFHRSLFACCLEIVIFSYNSQRTFPWVMEIFDLSAYHFYKVIEILIRAEDGLSRDVVKHLNLIEEQILESLAWKTESSLWEAIKQQEGGIPMCEEVSLPNQMEKDGSSSSGGGILPQIMSSPIMHPALKRIAGDRSGNVPAKKDVLQSPTGPSAADRFGSPTPGSAKRRLFTAGPVSGEASVISTSKPESPRAQATPQQQIITYQQAQTEDGRQVLIPVQIVCHSSTSTAAATPSTTASTKTSASTTDPSTSQTQNKPKKSGSLALFFRKVYHLASVRLRHVCEQLDVDTELRSKMWTCFEHTLVNHVDLMLERHIDQVLMCSVYVMAKVTGKDRSFQDIMKCYRLQPQAQSHVYRSVLLASRKRRVSGSSDSSKNGASGSNSPTTVKEETSKKDKKRREKLAIRSTSTLPVPEPSSQPPTPTKLAGTGTSFEFEDRGDLIKFYNSVYVKKMKNFALKFSQQSTGSGRDIPPLSPLPLVRPHTTSPRRVSNKHSIYISPHKMRQTPLTPQSKLLYCFNRSPAKDLRAINNMLRIRQGGSSITVGKRLLQEEKSPAESEIQSKRICIDNPVANPLNNRIQEILNDRQQEATAPAQ